MKSHTDTAVQAARDHWKDYTQPKTYKVTHRLVDVNDLSDLVNMYDLFILDRDCTLQQYHGTQRSPEFEDILQKIAPKSEIVSNSSFEEYLKIGKLYGSLFPVSKLVQLGRLTETDGDEEINTLADPFLLRYSGNTLKLWRYNIQNKTLTDETAAYLEGNRFREGVEITRHYKKPNPLALHAVRDINIQEKRIKEHKPQILMVGDAYTTDIAAANLAGEGFYAAKVKPYKIFSQIKDPTLFLRYPLEIVGACLSRMN